MKKREKMVKKPKKYQNYTQSYSNIFLIPNPYPNCMIRGGLLVLYTVSQELIKNYEVARTILRKKWLSPISRTPLARWD